MLLSSRLGPGLPNDFMKSFQATGWHITLSARSGESEGLVFKEGSDSLARKTLAQSSFLHGFVSSVVSFEWIQVGDEGAGPAEALAFAVSCADDLEMRGVILLPRDVFRNSNSKTEEHFLEYVKHFFLMYGRQKIAAIESQLLRSISSTISMKFVVVSRSGEILVESEGGIEFISGIFNISQGDHNSIQRKVESMLTHFEGSCCNANASNLTANRKSAAGWTEADELPCRVIRLDESNQDQEDLGPRYAIVEAKEIEMPDTETLRNRYALTPAEARVVDRLIGGLPVPEISKDLRLTNHTVRTYLKRSYGKIGVSGQAQLISKMSRLSCSLGTLPKTVTP